MTLEVKELLLRKVQQLNDRMETDDDDDNEVERKEKCNIGTTKQFSELNRN